MKKLACVLALSGAFVSTGAQAWGPEGHRAVGAIADKLLKGTNAEKRVAELLQGESLESVSVWMDTAKGGVGYAIPTPEMVEYTNANPKHSEYHYTDVPFQHTHYQDGAIGSSEHDIVQSLKQAIAVLQGKTDAVSNPHNFTERQALLLIAHMTGDIHQPLHVGAAFIGKDGTFVVPQKHEDVDSLNIYDSRGGNNLLLDNDKLALIVPGLDADLPEGAKKWKTRPFHSYWDGTAVNYAMRRISVKTPEEFAHKAVTGQAGELANAGQPAYKQVNTGEPATWPYQWANDALAVSKLAYTDVTPGKISVQTNRKGETYYTFNLEMGQNYPLPSSAIAKTQLIKGGYNLAAVLKAIWP